MITVQQLPESPDYGVSLYCAECQESYSATRGDYFWMPLDQPFTCECGELLVLVQRRTTYTPIAA